MLMSIETDIINALVAKLQTVTELKTINYDRINVTITDFMEHELPAVQLFDIGQTIQHNRGRSIVTWSMSIELIMKSLSTGTVSQLDLFELRRTIALALWDQPNLGVPGVIHLVYTGNITDLHTLEPYYIARLDFDVLYNDNLTGAC